MFKIFQKNNQKSDIKGDDFQYLAPNTLYFDSACQTLRPQQVIDAEVEYYNNFNSCGHRVNYSWGKKLDEIVDNCRNSLLKYTNKSPKNYTVSFGLNTTSGINSILMQLDSSKFNAIVTSDIEHNSVFLPSIIWAKKNNKKRIILDRNNDGNLNYQIDQLKNAIVILNSTSNIDGRSLLNAEKLAHDIHQQGGILLLDACQTFGHNPELLENVDFDAAFGSGHKMYAPSVGFSIIKKSLFSQLNPYLIGGGTVSSVRENDFDLIRDENELYSVLEPGLQNYAGIVGLNAALEWRSKFRNNGRTASEYESKLGKLLFDELINLSTIQLLNESPTTTICFVPKKIDGHQLGLYLGAGEIMVRTGYHCCHYYLKEKLNLSPTVRISLGLHNSETDITKLLEKLIPLIS